MRLRSTRVKFLGSFTRREFLGAAVAGGISAAAGISLFKHFQAKEPKTETFIASVSDYQGNLTQFMMDGFKALNTTSTQVSGKRVLLKPNLVEPHSGISHINTHPLGCPRCRRSISSSRCC
jgi:hypothetical protein